MLVEDWDQVDRVTPEGEAEARKALKSVPNPFGRFYIGPSLAVLDFATQSSFKQRTNREATRLILALRLYALQSKGTLPPSLRTLVERGIIEAVPTDRFSGRAFHYDATRKVFWSVGPNGRDDGGRGRPGGTSTKDADFVWSAAGAL